MQEKEFEFVTEKEERIAKNSNKKVLVIVMRCIFGIYGVDKFIMGCKKKALDDLVTGIILGTLPFVSMILFAIPLVGIGLYSIIVFFTNLTNIIRFLYFFITALRMINLTPREIAEKYERMI